MKMIVSHSIKKIAICFVVIVLTACGDSGESPSSEVVASESDVAIPSVLESFSVGENVYVRSLAVEDVNNSLWVGTSLGVHEIDLTSNNVLNTFNRDSGLANEYVFAINIDPQGYKWFGTNAGGVSRYKDGEWKTYFPMHGLADYWVYSFANHPDGHLWIGTWAGVNQVNLETGEFKTYVKELINEWVYGLDIDSKGQVWFGTEGGITMFDGQNWTSWNHKDGMGADNVAALPHSINTGLGTRSRHDLGILSGGQPTYNPNYVFTLTVDNKDTIWAGTWGGGVAHFEDGKWTNYTSIDGLAGNIVYSSIQDSKGNYWFGTNGGVSRFDGVSWVNFNRETGLLNNDVYAIAESPQGDIWVGTRGGVAKIGFAATKEK